MKTHTAFGLSAGAAALLALGVGLGRASVGEAPPSLRPLAPKAPAAETADRHGPHAHPSDGERLPEPSADAVEAGLPEVAEAEAEAESEPALDLRAAFSAARHADDLPDDHDARAAAQDAARDLHMRLAADPAALNLAIARFRELTDASEIRFMGTVLGQIADPEVEALALELALGDASAIKREAGLEILDAMNSPRARDVALSILDSEGSTALRRAALHAIPEPTGTTLDEAAQVTRSVSRVLASDADPETRRRAALLVGRYASEDDMAPLFLALSSDPDPGVRAGCAFACETSGRRTPVMIETLVRSLQSDEDPVVLENAWRALGAMSPLPPAAHDVYREHAEQREAQQEASE